MIDQQLREFSKEVKRGFVEALGNKSSFHEAKAQAKQDAYELQCEIG